MLRSICLILCFIGLRVFCSGQEGVTFSQVQLVDGSVIWGTIVDERVGQLTIKTLFSDSIRIDKVFIDRIFRDNIQPVRRGRFYFTDGHYFEISPGFAVEPTDGAGLVGIGIAYYKRINPNVDVGGGLSYKIIDLWDRFSFGTGRFLSPSINAKWYINKGTNRWHLGAKLGYGIQVERTNQVLFIPEEPNISSGIMGELAFGSSFCSRRKTRFFIEYRVNLQRTQQTQENNFDPSILSITTKRIIARSGLAFGIRF